MADDQVRAIAFPEGDIWVVHGVDKNLVAQGRTPQEATKAFLRVVLETIFINRHMGRGELERVGAAPARYRELFDQAAAKKPPTEETAPGANIRLRIAEAA